MYEEEDPKFYNFQCEKPFLGNRHYERKGLAYCETHYHQVQKNYHKLKIVFQILMYLNPSCLGTSAKSATK